MTLRNGGLSRRHAQVLAEALVKFTKWQQDILEMEDYIGPGETSEDKLIDVLYRDRETVAEKLVGGCNALIFMDAAKRIEALQNGRKADAELIRTLENEVRELKSDYTHLSDCAARLRDQAKHNTGSTDAK